MAYLKRDLQSIGGFDVTHRAAGDDVDVCWKLLVRELRIAFSPSAFVWHRRRSTVFAYLKQQRGYGYAEAHLHAAHPSRFNVLGHSVWKGNIYDSLKDASFSPLPVLFRPRIYQGFFGGAMFQSMYQPRISSWLILFKSIEWQVFFGCVLLSGLLGCVSLSWPALLLIPGVLGTGATLLSAVFSGVEASRIRRDQWIGHRRLAGAGLITLLHLIQPWARARGRVAGAMLLRSQRRNYPADQRLWGNIGQRDQWLRLLWKHLHTCGWICDAGGEWESTDLLVKGPGFHQVRVLSVYEEVLHRGFHWVRFRLKPNRRPSHRIGVLVLLAGLAIIPFFPALLPMLLPLAFLAHLLINSRRHTMNAISQAALECGAALDMPEVDPQYQK